MISDLYGITVHEHKLWPVAGISAFALQDTASSHALFSLLAFGQNAAFNRPPGLEAIAYKVKAIQIVNNRLMNPGDPSDGTIMAVTLLWQLEVSELSQDRWGCTRFVALTDSIPGPFR
jgi:hypothetical protein